MAEIVDTTRTQDHVTNDAGDCISTCPACAGFFGGPPARAEPSQSPQGECSHGETTSKPVVIMPQGNAGGSPAPLSSNLEVSAYTAAEWMSVGLIDKLVPLADYERLRAAIETVLAEDPGIAHHEQAAHCEWARKHLSIALASAGMPVVEAKACEFSDNARHECKHCDAEWAAVETSGWQPIETAPKDGRTLLLGYFNKLGNWRTVRGQWFEQDELDEWEGDDYGNPADWYETADAADDPPNCWRIEPTHWMPTPQPPRASEKAGDVTSGHAGSNPAPAFAEQGKPAVVGGTGELHAPSAFPVNSAPRCPWFDGVGDDRKRCLLPADHPGACDFQ